MEQNIFIKRLEEFAEIKRVRIAKSGNLREADTACDIFRNGETHIIDKDNNSTWAWEIKRLKPIVKDCEDCGKECKDRRVNKTLYSFPKKHWRRHCNGCNRVWNPVTRAFDLTPMQSAAHFTAWIKKQG
jgi:hypothetical protein